MLTVTNVHDTVAPPPSPAGAVTHNLPGNGKHFTQSAQSAREAYGRPPQVLRFDSKCLNCRSSCPRLIKRLLRTWLAKKRTRR